MNAESQAKYEARAKIIKAMAHPTRLFIVEKLSKESHSVSELTNMVGADVSTVSKHLSVLKNAGIVSAQKKGLSVLYSLRVPCVMNFFGCVETVLETTAGDHLQVLK